MSLSQAPGAPRVLSSLFQRHRVREVRPVFPEMARRKIHAVRLRASGRAPGLDRFYIVDMEGASEREVKVALKSLRRDPAVEHAHRESVYKALLVPNDPYFSTKSLKYVYQTFHDMYGIHIASFPAAWDLALGSGVVVAVLDTGVDGKHPDIDGNMWSNPWETPGNGIDDDGNGFVDDISGWDFITCEISSGRPCAPSSPVEDSHGHGTHVAGIIAAEGNNGQGIIGAAPGARVMSVKVLYYLKALGTDVSLANGIIYAVNNGADVINMSLGGITNSLLLRQAIAYAHDMGVILVAAVGDDDKNAYLNFPAAYPEVIAVAASDPLDRKAFFSNNGAVTVAAPGVGILSLWSAEAAGTPAVYSYGSVSGTSVAAPYVSGLAALILSRNPLYSSAQVRAAIESTADDLGSPGRDGYFGYGRINARRALEAVSLPPPFAPPAVSIEAPLDGETLSDVYMSQGTASGGLSLRSIAVSLDGRALARLAPSPRWSVPLSTLSLSNGTHTLSVQVEDVSGATVTVSRQFRVSNTPPPPAAFDPALQAPLCAVAGPLCRTETLIAGRGGAGGSPELGEPNTLNHSCGDGAGGGNAALLHHSIDSIAVRTLDGSRLTPGKLVGIDVSARTAPFKDEVLELYHAADANAPAWTFIEAFGPPEVTSANQVFSTTYVLPIGGLQAVRARIRTGGTFSSCGSGEFDDHDDLAFAVDEGPDEDPPIIADAGADSVSLTGARIHWTTHELADSRVEFGETPGLESSTPLDAALRTEHSQTLTNLTPFTTYYFRVISRDQSGHASESPELAFFTDGRDPTIAIQSPAPDASVTGIVRVSGSAAGPADLREVEVQAGEGRRFRTAEGHASWADAFDSTPFKEGPLSISARVVDTEGRAGFASLEVFVDKTPPRVAEVSLREGETRSGIFTVSGTASDNRGVARVEVKVDSEGSYVPAEGASSWSVSLDARRMKAGQNLLTVRATDFAGHQSTAAIAFIVENPPPVLQILSPREEDTLAGGFTISGTASDELGVDKVEVQVDSFPYVDAPGKASWSLALDAGLMTNGRHLVTVRATDPGGNASVSSVTVLADNPGAAVFDPDPYVQVPACWTVGTLCDSTGLLINRGSGGEPHAPNTLLGGCEDVGATSYRQGPSVDRLRIYTTDGSLFAPGKEVRVEATVTSYGGLPPYRLDLYHTQSARHTTQWTRLASLTPQGPGLQVLSAVFTLPPSGLQAIRARFWDPSDLGRILGVDRPCSSETGVGYADYDDLVFAVTDTSPPVISDLRVERITENSADIRWTTDEAADSQVEYGTTTAYGASTPPLAGGQLVTMRVLTIPAVDPVTFRRSPLLAPGTTYYFRALSRDMNGHLAVSEGGSFRTLAKPSITIQSPAPGSTVSGLVALSGVAWDDLQVTQVEVRVGTLPFVTASGTSNWTYSFDSRFLRNGPLPVVARVWDANAGVSAQTTLTVDNPDPQVVILSPREGQTVSGVFTASGTASDDFGIVQVAASIDNSNLFWTVSGTASWSLSIDAGQLSGGPRVLRVSATDRGGSVTVASATINVWNPASAVYDPVLKAPKCGGTGSPCDSTDLLKGRSTEPHSPNTIRDSCKDGRSPDVPGFNDRLRVSTLDNGEFSPGKTVRVTATVPGVNGDVDLFHAADANNPSWTSLGTWYWRTGGVVSATFTLPAGELQAVRARVRQHYLSNGRPAPVVPCGGGVDGDDQDDLVFAVKSTAPPVVSGVLHGVGASSATFRWTTDKPADSQVEYGTTTTYGFSTALDPTLATAHAVSLGGLRDATLYHYRVKSRDGQGNSAVSGDFTFTTLDATPPSISLSTAPAGAGQPAGAVAITAAASDNVGIAGVLFKVNGASLGEDATAPYSVVWNAGSAANGTYGLTAEARDAAGNAATSPSLTMQVTNFQPVKVNFQPASAEAPSGYLVDAGGVFADRGNGQSYGWNRDNAANVLDRNSTRSPNQLYDTLALMQQGRSYTWELAVPAGTYSVRLVAGDPSNTSGTYRISVEGTTAVDGRPSSSQRWIDRAVTVSVTDGRLTVSNARNADGNRICFIEITPASP